MSEKITVRELIKLLLDYNQDASMSVIANNQEYCFNITCGGGDGCTVLNCDSVDFYVEALNNSENSD